MSSTATLFNASKVLKGPHQISFDITNKCNLRCLHCYNNSGENLILPDELTDEEIMDFIFEVGKMEIFNFCFCGGETLLRKDLILKASSKLKEMGVPNISMVTNGVLLSERTALQLKEHGVNRIQISLDGANACSHDRLRNKKGVFEKAVSALRVLTALNIKCSVAFTPTSFNITEVEDVHKILHEIGIDGELRLQPLMLLGRADQNEDSINPSDAQYRQLVKDINRVNANNLSPKINWGDPVDHLVRFRSQHAGACINQCSIRANGDIVASAYLPLVIGNIKKHSFTDYWDHGLGEVWKNAVPKEIAKTIVCIDDMNNKNEGIPVVWQDKDIYIDLIDDDLDDLSYLFQ